MGKTGEITDKPSQHQGNFVRGKRSTGHEPMLDQPELAGAQISSDFGNLIEMGLYQANSA